ncbi:MAG TPA: HAD family hydrolase [Burkholderiales bacterium]|nr:HAD family hydrolase [Burkholderiales bacterium]
MRCELVIFDCDGVLVDSEPIANRVLSELLAGCGLRLDPDEVMRRFVGRTKRGCIELATELLGAPLPASFGADWDAALYAAFRAELRAVEGVTEAIDALEVPYCVATNSSRERLGIALEATGLAPRFEGRRFSAVDVARPKPAPDLFLHAAGTMGVPPARCVVVEDTPTGVRAAVAAGMTVLGFAAAPHTDAAALQSAGAALFHRMTDLIPALYRMAGTKPA